MRAPVGVVSTSMATTSLATTVQHVQLQVLGATWFGAGVAARVCREAGGRVRTNLVVREMDLGAFFQFDGLPMWGGSRDGVVLKGSATTNGKAEEKTQLELTSEPGRTRLVVLDGCVLLRPILLGPIPLGPGLGQV